MKKLCEHKLHINVIQTDAWVNAYCTQCGTAVHLHIDQGGRELLKTAAAEPVPEKEYPKSEPTKLKSVVQAVVFDESELEKV